MKVKYSVIIPTHRHDDRLLRLIASIPKSNSIQIIVVSDFCKDSFEFDIPGVEMHFTEKPKSGAGVCRNIGLQHATGEWVLFADSDDYFCDEAFSILDEEINHELDIIFFSPLSRVEGCNLAGKRHISYKRLVDNYISTKNKSIKFKFHVPWSKCFRRDFIESNYLRFSEVIASNDVMFSLKSGFLSSKIKASYRTIYVVTESSNSLTKQKNYEIINARLNEVVKYNCFLEQYNYPEFKISSLEVFYKYRKNLSLEVFLRIIRFASLKTTPFFPNINKFKGFNE